MKIWSSDHSKEYERQAPCCQEHAERHQRGWSGVAEGEGGARPEASAVCGAGGCISRLGLL